jgi:hypothetical protein
MPDSSALIDALVAKRTVRAALLVVITFNDSRVERLFSGSGKVRIGGYIYRGLPLLGIEGLEEPRGMAATAPTLSLSGVARNTEGEALPLDVDIVTAAVGEADLIPGAKVECSWQAFGDGGPEGPEWQPVGDPNIIGRWDTSHLSFQRPDATTRRLMLHCRSENENRRRPPASMYSASDQEQRYPGDRGGEFMSSMVSKQLDWPQNTY